jgi:hypothetical protein
MQLRENVEEEIKSKQMQIDMDHWVLRCINCLISVLQNVGNPCKHKWIQDQEELKISIWERMASNMDYIISWQKYVDEMKDVLSSKK